MQNLSYETILNFFLVILSLSPFIALGYYFGNLEKRVRINTSDISKIKQSLGVS